MDSLQANYASSDEEDEEQLKSPSTAVGLKFETKEGEGLLSNSDSKSIEIFSSLPPPKSSIFNSFPQPKSQSFPNSKPKPSFEQAEEQIDDRLSGKSKTKASSSSLFSSLPRPKSSSSSSSTAKKVVQFRPPVVLNPYSIRANNDDDDEDEDEGEKERQKKRSKESVSTSSTISFLSSIPAPRHTATLGAFPSALGAGRRSMIETNAPTSADSVSRSETVVLSNVREIKDPSSDMNYVYPSGSLGSEFYENHSVHGGDHGENVALEAVSSVGEDGAGVYTNAGSSMANFDESGYNYSSMNPGNNNYYDGTIGPESSDRTCGVGEYGEGNANYVGSYGYYSDSTQYENNWAATSIESAIPEVSSVVEDALQVTGRRGRRDAPPHQIVEVKQDELMKNRPREDQAKMTGIAFGPAYQPTSTKGKPTKLHKRKHQIGSLYFDMKQKESELSERRSKGYATKAQTQAKYGW